MSVGNKPIKIIKRKQRELPVKPRSLAHVELKTENQSRRELIRTVTSWIEERKGPKKELVWPSAFLSGSRVVSNPSPHQS